MDNHLPEMDQKDRQIERLETIIGQFGGYILNAPKTKFPWEAISTILAVAALLVSVTQGWAIMGKRLDDLEAQHKEEIPSIRHVAQIDWAVADFAKRFDQFSEVQKKQGDQLADIHETLVKMGLTLKPTATVRVP